MTSPEQAAQQLRDTHRRTVAGIRSSTRLTDFERRRRIAQADDDARTAMADLEATATADTANRRQAAYRASFGIGDLAGDVGSLGQAMRHAQQEAAALTTSAAAATMFDQAESIGDEVTAPAVAAHALTMTLTPLAALDRRWAAIVEQFAAARPSKANDVQRLLDTATPSSSAANLFTYVVPPSPDAA